MAYQLHGQLRILLESLFLLMKYRYVLPNILNGKLSATIQNGRNFAIAKFDEKFVNG